MTYLFIARFLARCALIGARLCSSAKRRAAFTSLADSDPGHPGLEARASRVRQHNKLLRKSKKLFLSISYLDRFLRLLLLDIGLPVMINQFKLVSIRHHDTS